MQSELIHDSDFGRYLEDFKEGMVIRHWPGKTITESDNNLFSLLTMNHHPVHLDQHYASEATHGQVLVVGTLVFSLAVGLTVREISGRAIANLNYSEVLHHSPVFIGDTIYAESQILSVRSSRSKPDRGVIKVKTTVTNQKGEKVLSFLREVLIPKKN
ncbi:MaoC family dehydratase [Thermophagus xiamenensis]|uniref:L-erythro-3-methylmalyl-CoA dehydratase n=1 Tax=Thermophagus xiamenensis TaxID=385682 RepID=A0A1I2E3E4_9BACT|nr:MaoC family dehydratase [Thermophagus xiamenensis]SFE87414.1 L-erythro-3-methylmalyl-CoA dehydratase [Thermophagus xiamenensis]